MDLSDASPWTIRGLYLFSLVLIASPMSDLISTVWPMLPGDLPWRYGFLGLSAGYLLTPILGLALAGAVAYGTQNGGLLKALGVLMTVLSVLVAIAMIIFLMDVMQMRSLRAEDVRRGIVVGAVLQELKYAAACLVMAMLGLGSFATARTVARSRPGRGGSRIVSAP